MFCFSADFAARINGRVSQPPLPKSLFGYNVVDRLGIGAHSSIYVVSESKSGQLYALKHVIPTEPKHSRFIEQLENEFKYSRTFRHPVLRKCFDLKIKKKLFGGVSEAMLLMELIDGQPLDKAELHGVTTAVDVFLEVADGLAALHHYNILHCDTKPNNILLTPEGHVKLIDFGQACINNFTKERVQGTPDFIAPEQARCRQLTYATDIYNFGATLYWALTSGRKVPTIMTVSREQREIIKEQKFPTPRELNDLVPEPLSELVMDCVNLKPAYRPQTIMEVIAGLKPYATPK
jgi:serine/threonine-protein kinase